jgi:hypothetical protein
MSSMRRSGGQAGGRRWPALAAAAAVTAAVMLALAACDSAAGSGKAASSSAKAGGTNLTMWLVTTGPSPANTVINQYAINVPTVMAAVLLSVLPLVVLFVVLRKQVMRSLGSVVMR